MTFITIILGIVITQSYMRASNYTTTTTTTTVTVIIINSKTHCQCGKGEKHDQKTYYKIQNMLKAIINIF